jgi:hypothetical protein
VTYQDFTVAPPLVSRVYRGVSIPLEYPFILLTTTTPLRMADPVGIITAIFSIIGYIRNAADKVQQNREECRRLATHTEDVLTLIKEEIEKGISSEALKRLNQLQK